MSYQQHSASVPTYRGIQLEIDDVTDARQMSSELELKVLKPICIKGFCMKIVIFGLSSKNYVPEKMF